MQDVVLFDELKAPVASADASPVDDSADDDEDDIDLDDQFISLNSDRLLEGVSLGYRIRQYLNLSYLIKSKVGIKNTLNNQFIFSLIGIQG